MIITRQLSSKRKLLDSITIRSRKHYIVDHMMEYYSVAFHTKRHRRHLRKLTTAWAELTNLDPKLVTDFKDLATTAQRRFMMPLPTLSDAMPVRSLVTSSIKHQIIFIQHLLYGSLRCNAPIPRVQRRYCDVYTRIFAKHQYKQESEYENTWCIIHSNIKVQVHKYHREWYNLTRILYLQRIRVWFTMKYT